MTDGRDQRVYREASALWIALYGDPPPARMDGLALLEAITANLPEMEYNRLRSPHLRPANITGDGAR